MPIKWFRQRNSGTETEKKNPHVDHDQLDDEDLDREAQEERAAEDHSINIADPAPLPVRRRDRNDGLDR